MTRLRGDGSWKRLPNKHWQYWFSLGVEGGVRLRRSVTRRTQDECREAADKQRRDWANRQPDTSTDLLQDYLERWVERRARFVRTRTADSYRSAIRNSIVPEIGLVQLCNLSHRDVDRMSAAVLAKGRAGATANKARAVLSAALRDAVRDGLMVTSPVSLSRVQPAKKPQAEPLTPAEVDAFLTFMREHRRWPLYVCAIALGMRQGEILGLRWRDIDGDTIRVKKTLRFGHGGKFALEETKTEASKRSLPIPPIVKTALQVQREWQGSDTLVAGDEWWNGKEFDLVFRSKWGRPLSGVEVTREFQRHLKRAGIPQRRFHDLRHTTATWLLAQGVDISVISKILGHSNIAITSSTYAHVGDSVKADALNRLDIGGQ